MDKASDLPQDALTGWVERHSSEVAVLLGFAVMITKVLRVAGDDPSTAVGVVGTTGILNVVAGVVAAGLSDLLLTILAVVVVVLATSLYRRARPVSGVVLVSMVGLLMAYLFQVRPVGGDLFGLYAAWGVLVVATVVLAWCCIRWMRQPGEAAPAPRRLPACMRLASALLIVLALVIGLGSFVNQRMWLPSERIQVADAEGKRLYVAYVLSSDERWTTLLSDRPRTIFRIPTARIEDRVICRLGGTNSALTLSARLLGPPSAGTPYLPPCRPLART